MHMAQVYTWHAQVYTYHCGANLNCKLLLRFVSGGSAGLSQRWAMQMPLYLAAALALALLTPPLTTAQVSQVCDPDEYSGTGAATPSLPDQFSLHVEANIVNRNRTTWVHELHDDVNNRGKLTLIRNGTQEEAVLDYNTDEIYLYPDIDRGNDCTVSQLTAINFLNFPFGITRINGTIHIGSARQFLEFLQDDTPVRQMGLESVRGIPTMRWQACVSSDNVSFTADYYYTTDDWTYATVSSPEDFDMTLVQIIINRTSNFGRDGPHDFYHVYSVIGFHSGPDSVPERAFQIPTGLVCVGREPGLPVPAVPQFFSTYIQTVDSDFKIVSTSREYYDFVHQLYRLDLYYDGSIGGDPGPYRIIHDFDSQVEYFIHRHTSNCTAQTLGSFPIGEDILFDEASMVSIASPNQLFLLSQDFNYTYEGVTTVRGVEVDSWISVREMETFNTGNLTDGVFEIFFTRPEYSIRTDRSGDVGVPVPWRVNLRGLFSYFNFSTGQSVVMERNVSFTSDFFDFAAGEPPYDAFDVSVCFNGDDLHTVIVYFNTTRVGIDFSTLRTNLRAGVVNVTGVRPLQVNNIHIVYDDSTRIFLHFFLTNVSELAAIDPDLIVTADDASDALVGSAQPGQPLPFQVDIGDGNLMSPYLLQRGRGRNMTCNITNVINNTCPTTPPPQGTTNMPCGNNITNQLKLTDGVVAGIAVGLFFAGFIVALLLVLICCVCLKCMSSKHGSAPNPVKYQKQYDDLDALS